MITVSFQLRGSRIAGVRVSGHSGYAEAGQDIVCAAVTSAVRLTETVINDVLGLSAPVDVREAEGRISICLPENAAEADEQSCQSYLAGLMLYCTTLHEEYPDHIEVRED